MSRASIRLAGAAAALALAALFVTGDLRSADNASGWGTVKGQVVFSGKDIPKNEPAVVLMDRAHCLAKGPILKNDLVINPKNKGIRWALVWLTGVDDPKGMKAIPIHPKLAAPGPAVEIDQPCCIFEPRVLGMREGQDLLIKNSSPISHNTSINGGLLGPNVNPLVPPKGQYLLAKEKIKARPMPFLYTCSIHAWMKGYVGVFKHPYFAVTDEDGNFTIKDAPAGKYRMMIWHNEGWVIINPKNLLDRGKVIEIKADGTTDVGKVPFEPSKD